MYFVETPVFFFSTLQFLFPLRKALGKEFNIKNIVTPLNSYGIGSGNEVPFYFQFML